MYSFISNDSAILEPHNDIIATALVVIGFVVFAAVMSKAYITYDEQSNSIENYEEASRIAESVASWDELRGSRPDILSAKEIDLIAEPITDTEMHKRFFGKFTSNSQFSVDIRTDDGKYHWEINKDVEPDTVNVIAASIPIIIETTPAQHITGTLTVRTWRHQQ
ncbi:hypothetical protein HNV12_25240 [Methanococcoides sp. SA1]|nr:hypothetical protein [Methanococcoides sp. SA1]